MNMNVAASTINENSLFSRPCHWVVLIPVEANDCAEFFLLLTSDEKKRADSFKSKKDRACFIIAHAFKRYCLSQLIQVDPGSLVFSCSDKGKPFCENDTTIDFNISHSDHWVVFGVSSIDAIGVDVERVDRVIGEKTIAYALNVEQALKLESSGAAVERMMLYWTQKEAVSKALGLGISVGFKNIECSGELGNSYATCNHQQFLVQSYTYKNAVLAIASQAKIPLDVYLLSRWSSNAIDKKTSKDDGQEQDNKLSLDKLC
jgi:phosphopantetheinyl transferase